MKFVNLLNKLWGNIIVRNIVYILGVVVGIILISMILLNIFTRHGKSNPVPNFKGMSMDSVKIVARKSNLKIEIIDSIYDPRYPKGAAYEQNPLPGTYVKKDRKIFLTLNSTGIRKEQLPNVVGYSLRQANAELKQRDFVVGRLSYVSDIATNNVLNQLLDGSIVQPGVYLPSGTKIDLQLGLEPSSALLPIPDLKGLTASVVRDNLLESSLNYSFVYDKTVRSFTDTLNSRAYKQTPEPNRSSSVAYGTEVKVYFKMQN